MRGARRGDAQPPEAAWRAQPATRRGSWTAQLDRCSIKQKRKNDQTVVPPGGRYRGRQQPTQTRASGENRVSTKLGVLQALDAGTPAGWVAGDEVYSADPGLRAGLEERQVGYVLAVAKNHQVSTAAGALRADALAKMLPPRAWQRLSAGPGAKGHRWYDWAWVVIDPGVPGYRWLMIRRHRRTRELAYYRCYSPRHVPLAILVRAAGRRWTVEEDFQASKGLAALDEHQVRTWSSWYRWVTLAMLALAFLTMAALAEHAQPPPAGLIPLTRNEIAHLATVIIQPARDTRHRLRWSAWRRRHQHTARTSHYQRQAARDP
jgi:hypothetical protein